MKKRSLPAAARRADPARTGNAPPAKTRENRRGSVAAAAGHGDERDAAAAGRERTPAEAGHGTCPAWRRQRRERLAEARAESRRELAARWPLLPREALPQEDFSVQVAPRGYVEPLVEELGARVITVRGRLVLAHGQAAAAWAQNVWTAPRWLDAPSIGQAVRQLTALQRNWRGHALPESGHQRRQALMEAALPHVASRPLTFGAPAPAAPLGAFALWDHDLLLASPDTTSPFADGEMTFVENRDEPPGRAYLKLWETFTFDGVQPQPGELCVDLGAAPGGWTWVLARLGARVFSLDKAELAPLVGRMPNVNHCLGSGFGLTPEQVGRIDWLFSDMICYPARLLQVVRQWIAARACAHAVCTLKFQAGTDHAVSREFAAIPGGQLRHLSCNKHELTFIWHEAAAQRQRA